MLKYILFASNVVFFLVYKLLMPDGLNIRQNLPATVEANKEYIVELTINKGSVQGFGKFQEDLPKGFSAEAIETKNGAFSFLDNSVKIIWMTLPGDAEFVVKYKIMVSAEASGENEILPKFSYFAGNEKTTFNLESTSIKVGAVAAATETASNETKKEETAPPEETKTPEEKKEGSSSSDDPAKNVNPPASEPQKKEGPIENQTPVQNNGSATCTRQINSSNPKELIVEVTISKGENTQFGKLEESLPTGFTATSLETKNGTFVFVDQKAKFSWLALPSEETFKVSYKIVPLDPANKTCTIEGLFSYLEKDGESKKNSIPAVTVNIGPTEKEPVKEETKENVNTAQNNTNETKKEKENTDNSGQTETKKEPQLTNIPAPQKGIIYRVQITATHKTGVEPVYFKDTYKLNEDIYAEMHQGWYKFTVGSFDTYNNARDKRENINQNIPQLASLGPFVTAYNNGTRITIQEALMISSQTWVK